MRTVFRRTKVVASAVALCLAGAVGVSSQAGAGTAELSVDPTTVEAGGVITVSQYCPLASVDVGVSTGWTDPWTEPTMPAIVEETGIAPDEGSQWSVQLTIPADAAPGSYTVWAECYDEPGEGRQLGSVELTVTPAPSTTSTSVAPSTTGSTTTDATTTTVAPDHAPAATAVPARPTYTG